MHIFEASLAEIDRAETARSKKYLIGGITLLVTAFLILTLDIMLPATNIAHSAAERRDFANENDNHLETITIENIVFTGEDFREIWRTAELRNVEPREVDYQITNSKEADEYIRNVGEERGYERQTAASGNLKLLLCCTAQEQTISNWQDMYQAALDEGVVLTISSAYRNQTEQAGLFREFLRINNGFNPSAQQIVSGRIDGNLQQTLDRVAPPGYSKHHTGYTLDICDANLGACATNFANTPAERWLSEDNYKNAKRFGFIPSYPPDVINQGPRPEPWEYVWVGRDNLTLERYVELFNEA